MSNLRKMLLTGTTMNIRVVPRFLSGPVTINEGHKTREVKKLDGTPLYAGDIQPGQEVTVTLDDEKDIYTLSA